MWLAGRRRCLCAVVPSCSAVGHAGTSALQLPATFYHATTCQFACTLLHCMPACLVCNRHNSPHAMTSVVYFPSPNFNCLTPCQIDAIIGDISMPFGYCVPSVLCVYMPVPTCVLPLCSVCLLWEGRRRQEGICAQPPSPCLYAYCYHYSDLCCYS